MIFINIKQLKMARNTSPDSVSSIVSKINIDETVAFENPYASIAVMVSNLKKKKDQSEKVFKIKYVNEKTFVTRIR